MRSFHLVRGYFTNTPFFTSHLKGNERLLYLFSESSSSLRSHSEVSIDSHSHSQPIDALVKTSSQIHGSPPRIYPVLNTPQAAKSRGRGIECFTELDRLLSYTESKQPQAVSQWVVHKYIEVWCAAVTVCTLALDSLCREVVVCYKRRCDLSRVWITASHFCFTHFAACRHAELRLCRRRDVSFMVCRRHRRCPSVRGDTSGTPQSFHELRVHSPQLLAVGSSRPFVAVPGGPVTAIL